MNPFNDAAAERSNRRVIAARRRQVAEEAERERVAEATRAARLASLPALPVIFRADRSGDFKGHATAVFPTLPGTSSPYDCTCYAHVGQHGTCGKPWYWTTRPATEAESADLLRELRGIYESDAYGEPVRLVPVKRWTRHHDDARRADLNRMNGVAS